ncbi:phosphatase PAP2 family protein [Flavobacterium sp.]|uniref:phosphatase PAP2 family protein n=1 Tax=Flavobacterium sp. TaxID=239 RepID=UPI0040481F3F
MNTKVADNFAKLKRSLFLLPVFFIIKIILFLFSKDALSINGYIQVQKDCFYFMNYYLGQYPNIEYNLTQFGDASIFLSFLIILIIYVPKIWESLLSALLVSAIFSKVLKDIFLVPRPAEVLDNNSFIIIGKTLPGFSSLPSGHSITVFTILTILMFAFMPKKLNYKILWVFLIIITGLILVSTRVGIGAHYPLDVIIGSIIGYISGITGIFISRKYKIWTWINTKKYYPIFIVLIITCCITLIIKIVNENIIVYYLALICLFVSLYKFIHVYIKK